MNQRSALMSGNLICSRHMWYFWEYFCFPLQNLFRLNTSYSWYISEPTTSLKFDSLTTAWKRSLRWGHQHYTHVSFVSPTVVDKSSFCTPLSLVALWLRFKESSGGYSVWLPTTVHVFEITKKEQSSALWFSFDWSHRTRTMERTAALNTEPVLLVQEYKSSNGPELFEPEHMFQRYMTYVKQNYTLPFRTEIIPRFFCNINENIYIHKTIKKNQ